MGVSEIVLLLLGGIIFTVSFFLPSGSGRVDEDTEKLVEKEVKDKIASELDTVKGKIEDIVDETVQDAMEKTERSLERVSNEKIMAVNEYSDTVLLDINKNHKEVMFLYDMLNDKQQNIQTTVSQVEKTVKEVEQSVKKAAQDTGKESVKEAPAVAEPAEASAPTPERYPAAEEDFSVFMPKKVTAEKKVIRSRAAKADAAETTGPDISFMKESKKSGNNNERILELHNQGKSNVAIAKELGLGVGEVKLVIDLFEGI